MAIPTSTIRRWSVPVIALAIMGADASALSVVQPAQADAAVLSSATARTSSTTSAARCARWRVKWPKVAVYEKPARIYRKVALKRRGQAVTGAFCGRWTYYNKRERVRYLAVKAPRADDKIGWIRLAAVQRIP